MDRIHSQTGTRGPSWVLPARPHEVQERWIVAQGFEVEVRVDVDVAEKRPAAKALRLTAVSLSGGNGPQGALVHDAVGVLASKPRQDGGRLVPAFRTIEGSGQD